MAYLMRSENDQFIHNNLFCLPPSDPLGKNPDRQQNGATKIQDDYWDLHSIKWQDEDTIL